MDASSQYDVEIEELHHTQKLDAPSGTAITIAEGIIANLDRKVAWKNEVIVSENELAIESIRMEDVPGTHIVKYESDIDVIEIKHEAKNRNGFAFGAVIAAEYINGKNGVFTMKDVLSL